MRLSPKKCLTTGGSQAWAMSLGNSVLKHPEHQNTRHFFRFLVGCYNKNDFIFFQQLDSFLGQFFVSTVELQAILTRQSGGGHSIAGPASRAAHPERPGDRPTAGKSQGRWAKGAHHTSAP